MSETVVERVENLFKMPQSLCKKCGQCCKVVCFKSALSYDELKDIIEKKDSKIYDDKFIEGVKDFLALFLPYRSLEDAKKENPSFVEKFEKKTFLNVEEKQYFYYCRFLSEKNQCLIHEDRPSLCRMYPIPNERTIFYDNCGYEKTAEKNLKEINNILETLKKGERP